MNRRPMIFFATGDCGCDTPPEGIAPCVAPASTCTAVLESEAYLTLLTAPKGQVVVVPKQAKKQAFLSSAFPGFLFFGLGEVTVTKAPLMTLPIHNPAVDDVYPEPDEFRFLTIGVGNDPTAWKHLAAPTVGTWNLQAKDGHFELLEAGAFPGIDVVGGGPDTTPSGGLMMVVETAPGSGTYVNLRLEVHDKRVVVGFVDTGTGEVGYRPLPDASFLEHPKAKFPVLQLGTLETLDDAGSPISGGVQLASPTGAGAVTDGVRLIYSPSFKRLFQAPAHTVAFVTDDTDFGSALTPPDTYGSIPSGHGAGIARTINYPNVRIDFNVFFSVIENLTLGIFRDGSLIKSFNTSNTPFVCLFYVDQGVSFGSHTYEVRWQKYPGTGNVRIVRSSFLVTTLG